MYDGTFLGKFRGGGTFPPGKKVLEHFGANFGEYFGQFVSKFASFFGNFVQQKGDINILPTCST